MQDVCISILAALNNPSPIRSPNAKPSPKTDVNVGCNSMDTKIIKYEQKRWKMLETAKGERRSRELRK